MVTARAARRKRFIRTILTSLTDICLNLRQSLKFNC